MFLGTLVVLGLCALRLGGGATALRGARRASDPEPPPAQEVPRPELALPDGARLAGARELFVPPSDTRPLPPLAPEEPPRAELALLLPPCDPGPAPRAFDLLRARVARFEAPALFDPPEQPEVAAVEGDEVRAGRPARVRETPAQELARQAGYRARHDWIQRRSGTTAFGRIVNDDRYGLPGDPRRAAEPLRFVQVDPETGREVHASLGAPAIDVAREDVLSFGFAETPANALELERRRFGAEPAIDAARFAAALEFAERALALRHDAPRALAIAEELGRACAAYDPDAAEPGLLLARVAEARFDFEGALRALQALADAHPSDVEPAVELAGVEERFLLDARAEERLRAACALPERSWLARAALGRFLLARGRADEALPELARASLDLPQDPGALALRADVRTALGACHLALGAPDEAARVLAQVLAADPTNERALAGLRSARLCGARTPGVPAPPAAAPQGTGFELLLAGGVEAVLEGRGEQALELLRQAQAADPLRAQRPLAALSFLAEASGHPEQALSFAQGALEHTPDDVWSLYQRGRLLLARDDPEGAHESFLAALAAAPSFADALLALGETAFRRGDFEGAERYLARALALEGDGARAPLHALRGWNALRRGAAGAARESFERAVALEEDDPVARAGLAWCTYQDGDATEARVQLADLDRARRALPEDDPYRAWARAQIARIADHAEKVEWIDDFERLELRNGWTVREGAGPLVTLQEGAVHVQGVFAQAGRVGVFREYAAAGFVSFEVDVWIDPATTARAGLFVARERVRQDASDTLAEVAIARQKDGALELSFARKGVEPETVEVPEPFPVGRWVRLRAERSGAGSDSRVTLSLDGIALIEGASFAALGSTASPLQAGVFVQGDAGRRVALRLDDAAAVVRR